MSNRWSSRGREGLAGSLLVIAIGLLTLGLFVMAVMATPRVEAASRHSHDSYRSDDRRQGDSFHWDGRLARGRTLEIRGINGSIQVEGTSGSDVVVDAEKRARKSDPDEVKIDVEQTRDGIRICARYPRRDGSLNDDCENQQTYNNDVEVRYLVKVPAGVNLAARTVNGRVEVDDLHGDVEAATVNGSIQLSTTGVASANTVNGSIRASIGEGDWKDGLEFRTVNGSIDLTMPGSVNANLTARSMNGQVNSDFPITTSGRINSHRLIGTIGDGGPSLHLGTINGGIDLHSSGRTRRDRD
jgi:hypothetical protein